MLIVCDSAKQQDFEEEEDDGSGDFRGDVVELMEGSREAIGIIKDLLSVIGVGSLRDVVNGIMEGRERVGKVVEAIERCIDVMPE